MADTKITDLTELVFPASGDLFVVVDDPSGSPVNKKITRDNLMGVLNVDNTPIGVSGTVAFTVMTDWNVPGGFLSAHGGIYGYINCRLGHAIASSATVYIIYGGVTGSASLTMIQGTQVADKDGYIEFFMNYSGDSLQSTFTQCNLADGTDRYYRGNSTSSAVNSAVDQTMTLAVQWNAANNGCSFTAKNIRIRAL